MTLERQLYLSLKGQPCRCQYERDKRGVPIWEGIPLARKLISRCTRCVAVEDYEATHDAATGEPLPDGGDL